MPKDYFKLQDIRALSELKPRAKVYCIGVAGVAMGQLAVALAKKGYEVSGSDKEFYEPMGTFLKNSSVTLFEGYQASNVPLDADLVVIGNAISYGHDEVAVVEEQGLPYTCFPQLLFEAIISGRKSLVMCGTHGKSTTTAMTASVLRSLDKDPSYFIGGVVEGFPSSLEIGAGPFSVVEGDEYDSAFFAKVPKFVFYKPTTCVINAVEFDHADIYPDLNSINREFTQLVASLSSDDTAVCCLDFANLKSLAAEWKKSAACRILTFGADSEADFRITHRSQAGGLSQEFTFQSAEYGEHTVFLPAAGAHNARNALAVIVACLVNDLPVDDVIAALKNFQAVKRRQEVKYDRNGVVLIEDFAHHPTEVQATISAVREAYPNKQLWAIFQPRSNTSRRKVFQDEYLSAFSQADCTIISEVIVRSHMDANQELLDTHELAQHIAQAGGEGLCLKSGSPIAEHVLERVGKNDVILVMSNGSFEGLIQMLEDGLQDRNAASQECS